MAKAVGNGAFDFSQSLKTLLAGRSLSLDEARAFVHAAAQSLDEIQLAALLTALSAKKETAQELAGAALGMRELAIPVMVSDRARLVDTCGTGGDALGSFNVSTAAAIIAAAAGARVAKHGNRSASGRVGSADILESFGVPLTKDPEEAARLLDTLGIVFFFAPAFHPAMQKVASLRRRLGVRTLFNFLGPLANPAQVKRQVLGVPEARLLKEMPRALSLLGVERALVVFGEEELDEISISGVTHVAEVQEGHVFHSQISPEDLGVSRAPLSAVTPKDFAEAREMFLQALSGKGPCGDMAAMNAAAALYAAGVSGSLKEAMTKAREALREGAAMAKLEAWTKAGRC